MRCLDHIQHDERDEKEREKGEHERER